MALKLGELFFDIIANTSKVKDAEKEVDKSAKKMKDGFSSVGKTIAAAFTFNIARRMAVAVDSVTLLRARVDNLASSQKESNAMFEQMVRISNDLGSSIDNTVKSVQRFSMSREVIQASNDDLLKFTETIQQLGFISGATQLEIAQTSIQIGQAMANNFEAAAQEINSINEQIPAVARAVEKSLELIPGSFKKAVSSGQVSAKQFFGAILEQAEAVDKKFRAMPVTMSLAWQELVNVVLVTADEINKATGFTQGIVGFFKQLSSEFSDARQERKATLELEKEIARITTPRRFLDRFDPEIRAAKELNDALKLRRKLLQDLSSVSPAGQHASVLGIQQNALMSAQEDISRLQGRPGRTAAVMAAWQRQADREAAQAAQAASAAPQSRPEAFGPPEALPGQRKKGKNFQQFLAALGDERAAVNEEYDKLNEEIIMSQKLNTDEMDGLIKSAGERRIQALKDVTAAEQEVWQKRADDAFDALKEEREMKEAASKDQLRNDRASRQAVLLETASFGRNMLSLMSAMGQEQSAAAKAIFLALQAVRIATIIANAHVSASVVGVGTPMAKIVLAMGYASAAIVGGLAIAQVAAPSTPRGGGRQSGGPVSAGRMYQVAENGEPELLMRGSKQYLIPGNKSGQVISGKDMRTGGGSAMSIKIINQGAPLEVTGQQITRDEAVIMVRNAENSAVSRVDASLRTGRGSTASALQSGFVAGRKLA